jgi:hypothetical protein
MLEELNIMKLNFEVKHRFDISGTLITDDRNFRPQTCTNGYKHLYIYIYKDYQLNPAK